MHALEVDRHADVYAQWGETYAQVAELVGRVRAEAARRGRKIRFSPSLRPILAGTEAKAWDRADDTLARARAGAEKNNSFRKPPPENTGSQRLLAAAAQGARSDKHPWTGIAGLLGAQGSSTALVGTPDQVADALLDCHDLGIIMFLIRGSYSLQDAIDSGRDLLPLTRDLIARRRPKAA